MEEEEYKKLSVEDRCVHKLWKARVSGYEEVTKLFRQIDDEKSPEFSKYLGLVKKFVTDSNALGLEKGLEAALAFVENYAHAGKTAGEVMSGVVSKCIAAPKAKTRELALQIILMYIEIEKQEVVQEELLKGMEHKNPKIVSACVNASTTSLREFGVKIVNVKPLVKKIPLLFADRDKDVRGEARQMVIEMYRWIGPALKSQLTSLQPVQMSDLEAEFTKMENQKAVPMRFIRSQQQKQIKMIAEANENNGEVDCSEDNEPAPIDPYDLADPVDILSKLPKDFYEKIEAKKWQDRKEALEVLENLLKTPKLENGDYGDLVRALRKIIQKDSNVIVVALGARCMAGLASGLKKRFNIYSGACISPILEKFKEKKANVVAALRDAIDAVYQSTTIEAILDDVLEALNNKNPSMKAETTMFLARCFTKTPATMLNKKLLKTLTGALLKNINEPDPTVRDCAAEALGTLMKLVGEKAIAPFLSELEKDNLKMSKIKDCAEKAVLCIPTANSNKDRPVTAPVKASVPVKNADAPRSAPTKTAKKSGVTTRSMKASGGDMSSAPAAAVKNKKATKDTRILEKELCEEEIESLIADVISANVIMDMSSANWKDRLSASEQFLNELRSMDSKTLPTQAVVRTLVKRPGLKDTNFQVLKVKLDIVRYLAENGVFSSTTAGHCLNDICDKIGDPKNGTAACEVLTAISESISLDYVSSTVIDYAFSQKSPKVLQESLIWLSNAIKDFGFNNLDAKLFIESSKKALASNNPGVRQASITLLGTLYLYMGNSLNMFFENEKPALREQINTEFVKYDGMKPPAPSKGLSKCASARSLDDLNDNVENDSQEVASNHAQDILPRLDISNQITESLINELNDKNWKNRNEALTKVSTIIQEAGLIKPNIGDLPQALAARLTDSNTKIAQTAMNTCEALAKAMGPSCKQYIKIFFPGFLQGLGDNKAWMRSTALDAINAYSEQCGYKEFFENEMIADALKSGSPTLRSELWLWLSTALPKVPLKSVPKEEFTACIPHLYSNLEDRNADVRKNAQEAILGFMIHLGYEAMAKHAEKLKPGSRSVIMTALEKVRPNLPTKPLPKKQNIEKEEKTGKNTKTNANSKTSKNKVTSAKSAPSTNRKKEDDTDYSPLLVVNNMKHQRTIDESKLKVLKWNFTTPREEFVELLKDQMLAANVNKTLIFNMFHSDFRYHLKAIDSLMEDLPDNSQALISNLDLILKWLTLRFFDTNPSVLLRGLEYLHSVFNLLIENNYHMLENEASSFIPYLILKIGDPKDAVRNGVRSLFRQICEIYAVSRLCSYVMEGVKAKNARQRAECLELMGSIIEDYGITVCLPTPAACLKEVAKQISDRDNSVRNAALNCIVQAYHILGDKVYKMIGNISDKDMSLLEERIKRTARRTLAKPKIEQTVVNIPSSISHSPQKELETKNEDSNKEAAAEDDLDDEDNIVPVTLPSQLAQETEEVTGPFRLDPEFMKQLDSVKYVPPKMNLQIFDLDFLREDIKIPSLSDARTRMMPLSPPKPIAHNEVISRLSLTPSDYSRQQGATLEKTINQMSSSNKGLALQAMEELQEILQSPKSNTLIDFEDAFMSAVTTQLRILRDQDPIEDENISKVYRRLLTLIDTFYLNKILGRQVSVPVLKGLISELVVLLVEKKLETCASGDSYIRVVNLHCVKIIERSDHTRIICALINLIQECIRDGNCPKLTDLVMKCLWRVIKLMPQWGNDINYDAVLLEVHEFLKEFPSSWWKKNSVDTPLRTVKTILHSSVKIKGSSIMLHLGKIPNTSESEVESYILRLLKGMKLEEVKQVPLKSESNTRSLCRANHNMLTDIFQKIGSRNETKEGLTLLYDFLQQHPEADIEPFLKKSSKFFQDYIKNGLQEIEESRKKQKTTLEKVEAKVAATITSAVVSTACDNSGKGPEYWKERLNMWNKKWENVLSGTQ